MDLFAIFSVAILFFKTVLTSFQSSPNYTHCVKSRPILYTRRALLSLRPDATVNISVDLLSRLRSNNICTTKKTRRGKRGGTRKIQIITSNRLPMITDPDTFQHVNKNNLIKIKLSSIKRKQIFKPRNPIDKIKILLLNLQSVGKKEHLINDLVVESNADLLFFTETWLLEKGDEMRISTLTPPCYVPFSVPRLTGPGGGILVLVKKSILNTKTQRIKCFTSFECSKTELVLNNESFTFFCVYRAPPSEKNNFTPSLFISEFEQFLDSHVSSNIRTVILGDINLHFNCPHETYVKQMSTALKTRNLFQIVNSPTHIKGNILDWIIVNDSNFLYNVQICDKAISDHFVITCNMDIEKPEITRREILTRNIKSINSELFSSDLRTCSDNIIVSEQPDKSTVYDTSLSDLIGRHAPLRTRTVTDRMSAQWMTGEIKSAKVERRRLERQWRKTRLPEHKVLFMNFNIFFNNIIKNAKKSFYENSIANSTSSKTLFNFVSNFYGKSSSSILPSAPSLSVLVENFSLYFIDKISSIRSKLDCISNSMPDFDCFNGIKMHCFEPVSIETVKNVILSSSPKSCFLDPIPTSLLFTHIDNIVESITTIINDSLSSGIVPSSFKHALVKPLLKKCNLDNEVLKNYRPVSNLSFISKILEKIVSIQINKHLSTNKLLESHQSAYRKHHNTETALLKIFNDLLLSADQKKISVLVLLDLSAAFDTIDHTILVERLRTTFGFDGTVLNWFKSYLSDRTQSVLLIMSHPHHNNCLLEFPRVQF